MGLKKTPFGYEIINGKIKVNKLTSKYVKRIFNSYLSGMSINKITKEFNTKKIKNQSGGTSWTHGVIGKILSNTDYLGDDIYPKIISKQVFKHVAEIREEKNRNMNRNINLYANSITSNHYFNNKLVCGECGASFKRYLKHHSNGKESYWRCRNYIIDSRTSCKCGAIDDKQIEQKFNEIVNLILSKPMMIKRKKNIKIQIKGLENIVVKSIDEKIDDINYKLINKINELSVEEIDSNIEEIEKLIFQRTSEKYKTLKLDDYKYQTKKLEEMLRNCEQQVEFNKELFNKMIKKVIVFLDERIEFELINGVKIGTKYDIKIKYN